MSRYRRFIYRAGGLDEHDMLRIEEALSEAGVEYYRTRHLIVSPEIELSVDIRDNTNWVETRREAELDRAIDEAFGWIFARHHGTARPAKAHCSDCYACCQESDTWLEIPQYSSSCRATQTAYPSRHFLPSYPLEDPLFLGELPHNHPEGAPYAAIQ